MNNSETSRLRVPPSQRFEGPQHAFNFQQIAQDLRAEDHDGQSGHRQITLLHQGGVTMVAFAFESGGTMPDHAARGLVMIQIIEGDSRSKRPTKRINCRAVRCWYCGPMCVTA